MRKIIIATTVAGALKITVRKEGKKIIVTVKQKGI